MADETIDILAVTFMDIRSTVESMRRSVTAAQSSIEQFRHTQSKDRLVDIADCLSQLTQECVALEDSIKNANSDLGLIMPPAPGTH
jgi:hypothetical protein